MFRIRQSYREDVEQVLAVAEHLDTVNLPHDRGVIEELLDRSERSFAGAVPAADREFLFVLEDLAKQRIIGTSMIYAQHGTKRAPHIFFRVENDERYSVTIDAVSGILSYSRESNERLLGIFGQDQEITEWAERNGYQIVGHAHDVKVHGQTPPMERPGLSAAIRAVEEGEAGGIAVYRLSRLSRDFETQNDAMNRIWNANGKLFSVDYGEWKPDKPGDPQYILRRQYARMAEDELHTILDRLQAGRKRKMARGGYGGGYRIRRRYGVELVYIQGKLEYRPIPKEQAVIRRICDACLDGRGYETMSKALNAEGIPTATGAPWSRTVVRDLALRGPDRLVAIPPELPIAQPLEWIREATA